MKTDLIYGVEDRPPFKDALFAALQHLLAIFVAIITPPLIIASALKLDVEKTSFLVSMSLFASGVSTFTMPPLWCDRSKTALHPGNQFFFYRPYHCHRDGRRITVNFRFLYGCCAYRNDCQPHIQISA